MNTMINTTDAKTDLFEMQLEDMIEAYSAAIEAFATTSEKKKPTVYRAVEKNFHAEEERLKAFIRDAIRNAQKQ